MKDADLFNYRFLSWRQACLDAANRWLKGGDVERMMLCFRLIEPGPPP